MTEPIKVNARFSEFQKAILSRLLDGDEKKKAFIQASMMNLYLDGKKEENKEVKMNVRFLSRSYHAPIVYPNLQEFAPNPQDIQKRNTLKSRDSVLQGVFTALNYDKEILHRLRLLETQHR